MRIECIDARNSKLKEGEIYEVSHEDEFYFYMDNGTRGYSKERFKIVKEEKK